VVRQLAQSFVPTLVNAPGLEPAECGNHVLVIMGQRDKMKNIALVADSRASWTLRHRTPPPLGVAVSADSLGHST
jgi:hypothetical protein